MLTPAQLLLVERLIAVFVAFLAALANGEGANAPSLSRSLARKAINRLVADLERLRDAATETAPHPEAKTAATRAPRTPRRRNEPVPRPRSDAEPLRTTRRRAPHFRRHRKRTSVQAAASTHA